MSLEFIAGVLSWSETYVAPVGFFVGACYGVAVAFDKERAVGTTLDVFGESLINSVFLGGLGYVAGCYWPICLGARAILFFAHRGRAAKALPPVAAPPVASQEHTVD